MLTRGAVLFSGLLDLPKEANKTATTMPFTGINVRNPKDRDGRGGDRARSAAELEVASGFFLMAAEVWPGSGHTDRGARSHRRGEVS